MTRNDQQTVTEKNLKGQLDRKAVSNKKGFAKKGSKNTSKILERNKLKMTGNLSFAAYHLSIVH